MRIGIFGAGGVGGYFGARLAAAGHDVTFIARGAHLEAMRQNGLSVKSPLGDVTIDDVSAVEDVADASALDLLLISVKLWSTETVARAVRPLAESGTAIVSFQNGVAQYDVLRRELPDESLFAGIAFISATIQAPGVIAHHNDLQALHFGEFDGRTSERVAAFKAACDEAGLDAEISDDIGVTLWQKFVMLTGLSATTAAMRQPIGAVRSNEQTRRFLYDIVNEVVTVGRARGINLAADHTDKGMRILDSLDHGVYASMAHDLAVGNRLELPWLSGAVVDFGRELNVATPCNRAVADILALYAAGTPDSIK